MAFEKAVLGVLDYIIFSIMLLISAGIGIYFRLVGGRQKTTVEYLLAGRDMSLLPVAFSLMASGLSAITLLGTTAEMYKYGVHLAYIVIGWTVATVASAYLFLPVFFDIQATTAYEYLDRRFGVIARTLTSVAFVLQMILYMAVALYAPALALSAVTDLSTWVSVVSIGVVCTFYCTIGGMKAVLWTDVFQALLMYLCVLSVIIYGCINLGGIGNIFRIAGDGGRLVVPGFSADPTIRYTAWGITLQGIYMATVAVVGSQVQVQRLLTVKNISRSQKALFISIPMNVSFFLLNCLVGLVIYATFADCNPMTSPDKPISSYDQLLPYYVMSSFEKYPGLPGLCICGIFSACLSTVSSAVNCLTAVTMQDLIQPLCAKCNLSQKVTAFTAKAITCCYGVLFVMLAFLVAAFGNVLQVSITINGMIGGPTLGIFFLGMMTTRTNEKGAIIGLLSSLAFSAWISFGSSANSSPSKPLAMSNEGCLQTYDLSNNSSLNINISSVSLNENTLSSLLNFTESTDMTNKATKEPFILYRFSYMWYAPIGFAISTLIGYLASILINFFTNETNEVPPEFLSPAVRWLYRPQQKKKHAEENVGLVSVKKVRNAVIA